MMKKALLACAALPLGGCVPMMAANALGMAVASGTRGQAVGNEAFQPTARQACSARAQAYGTVHVIDVEQHTASKIIVWGTVDDGKTKRSFQCDYSTRITGFRLRTIANPPPTQ